MASAWAGLVFGLLLALAPLEFRETTPVAGLQMTLPELLAGLAAAVGTWAAWREGLWPRLGWRTVFERKEAWPVWALAGLAGVHAGSVLWSEHRPLISDLPSAKETAKFAARVVGAIYLGLLACGLQRSPEVRRRLSHGLLAGLGLITLAGVAERLGGRALEPLWLYFRDEPTWMLGEQRLSTVFAHANTQAAYFELTAPWLLLACARAERRWQQGALIAWLAVVGVLLSLTYSRAGFGAAVVGAAVLGLAGLRQRRRQLLWLAVGYALVVVGAYVANPDMRARVGLTARSYQADYEVKAPCVGHAGSALRLPVEVRNRGEWPLADRHAPGDLMHRWLALDGTPLARRWAWQRVARLPPGARVKLDMTVQLPTHPGTYALALDFERDRVLRISELGNPIHLVECIAAAPGADLREFVPAGLPPIDTTRIGKVRPLELERRHYWRAALLLWERRPWLGWGDDSFRHIYHEYAVPGAWDPRARAHSWLLETAVDLGLVGVLALALLAAALARAIVRLVRARDDVGLAAAAAVGGLAVHLQVDYFLAYTQIALIFWPLVGVLLGAAAREPPWQASASNSTVNPPSSPPA